MLSIISYPIITTYCSPVYGPECTEPNENKGDLSMLNKKHRRLGRVSYSRFTLVSWPRQCVLQGLASIRRCNRALFVAARICPSLLYRTQGLSRKAKFHTAVYNIAYYNVGMFAIRACPHHCPPKLRSTYAVRVWLALKYRAVAVVRVLAVSRNVLVQPALVTPAYLSPSHPPIS